MYNKPSEEELKANKKIKKALVIAIIATLVLIAYAGAVMVGNMTGPAYKFQKAVHSHIENAYWASTPELMENQIELAVRGMTDLGLTPDMYGKLMPWEQTPDWQMSYCYLHLQAIIDRCHEVIDWRTHQDLSNGQITDVYNQKMSNLHNFLFEGGWSDDIAKNAYYANFHAFYYIWCGVIGAAVFLLVGLAWLGVATSAMWDDEDLAFWVRIMGSVVIVVPIVLGAIAVTLGM